MLALIAILVFVVVAMGVFAVASLLDQRSARARLLRERLATVQEAAARQPSEELALLRDEMLSNIPAVDNLLRRSSKNLRSCFPRPSTPSPGLCAPAMRSPRRWS